MQVTPERNLIKDKFQCKICFITTAPKVSNAKTKFKTSLDVMSKQKHLFLINALNLPARFYQTPSTDPQVTPNKHKVLLLLCPLAIA